MSSILSRFRRRRTSTISSSSRTETTTTVPPTPSTTQVADPVFSSIPSPTLLVPVDRKILPDPDSWLDSFAEEPEEATETAVAASAVAGLRPSGRKRSADTSRRPGVQAAAITPEADDDSRRVEGQASGGISAGSSSPQGAKGSNRFIRGLSQIASPGEWSTFGRRKEHVSPVLGDFGLIGNRGDEAHGVGGGVELTTTESIGRRPSSNRSSPSTAPKTTSTPSHTSPIPQDSSPSGTTSSKNKSPKTPEPPRSNDSHSFFTSSPVRDIDEHDSPSPPRTFGHLTPPESRRTGLNLGLGLWGTPGGEGPPPMPALDHPALSSRSKSSAGTGKSRGSPRSSPASRTLSPVDLNTYPPHQRPYQIDSWAKGSGRGTTSSLPLTFGRSRSHSNLPKAQQIFTSTGHLGTNSTPHRRSRTASSKSKRKERRTSADWNAQQATEEVGWPALVSKEILKMTFGGGGGNGSGDTTESGRVPVVGSGRQPKARADNVPDAGVDVPGASITFTTSSHQPCAGRPISFQGQDVDDNLSGLQSKDHGHFISGGVEVGDMKTKDPARTEQQTTASIQEKTAGGLSKTSLSSPSDPTLSSPAFLQIPPSLSITSPTPDASPFRPDSVSDNKPTSSTLQIPATIMKTPTRTPSDKSRGKRKADDLNITPPDQKKDAQHATFAPVDVRPLRVSDSSHAPSSYQNKRARLSAPVPTASQPREASTSQQPTNYGSWSSRTSSRSPHNRPSRTPSRVASSRSASQQQHQVNRASSERRTSISQMSIPISALVSPHAPSISRSSKFHMQDPRKPPRKRDTGWALRFKDDDEAGSPIHAWLFFLGFVLFPLWWAASVMSTPRTRHVGGSDVEKAVPLDDPQIEYDAKAWRFRCRIMTAISFFTYIPFIALVAVFA